MNIKKRILSMIAVAVSTACIAAGVSVNAAGIPIKGSRIVHSGAVLPAGDSSTRAVENSNSYYAYPTGSIIQMGIIQIAGKEYTLPLTMEQLSADGWKKSVFAPKRPGERYVISCGEMQLSLSEDQYGQIETLVDLYPPSGTLVIPANAGSRAGSSEEDSVNADGKAGGSEADPELRGIKAGIREDELISCLNELPLPWESVHLKNGTTRYRVLVPLGGKMDAEADGMTSNADDRAKETPASYPACEYAISVGDRQVRAIGIRMISDPGPDGWSDEVLGYRVAVYYENKAGERPPFFRIEEQKDGRILIRLFEEIEDHIATWALYRSDRTGKGYDVAFDPNEKKMIDFMK